MKVHLPVYMTPRSAFGVYDLDAQQITIYGPVDDTEFDDPNGMDAAELVAFTQKVIDKHGSSYPDGIKVSFNEDHLGTWVDFLGVSIYGPEHPEFAERTTPDTVEEFYPTRNWTTWNGAAEDGGVLTVDSHLDELRADYMLWDFTHHTNSTFGTIAQRDVWPEEVVSDLFNTTFVTRLERKAMRSLIDADEPVKFTMSHDGKHAFMTVGEGESARCFRTALSAPKDFGNIVNTPVYRMSKALQEWRENGPWSEAK